MQVPKSFKVLLIGDSCTDVYVYGDVKRFNPEAPTPLLDFKRMEFRAGMCLNVEANLKAFGLDVTTLTNAEKITKTRYCDEKFNQQLLRVDEEDTIQPLDVSALNLDDYDAIVISDYNKGFVLEEHINQISQMAFCPVFVDTKKVKIVDLGKDTFFKINQSEYKKFYGYVENLIITLGDKGASYNGVIYPTDKVETRDIVGAGDTFLAALTYGYLIHGEIQEAIRLANRASGIAVSHSGTYVLTPQDVQSIINSQY